MPEKRPSITFVLSDWHSNPPQQAGGVCVAAPSQSLEALKAEIEALYKDRLIKMEENNGS